MKITGKVSLFFSSVFCDYIMIVLIASKVFICSVPRSQIFKMQ